MFFTNKSQKAIVTGEGKYQKKPLESANYALIRESKPTKSSLEKSKKGLSYLR